jgi:hypothetical protein
MFFMIFPLKFSPGYIKEEYDIYLIEIEFSLVCITLML